MGWELAVVSNNVSMFSLVYFGGQETDRKMILIDLKMNKSSV